MNVVIYARYSSDNQSEESITAQLRACNEYAVKNNMHVIDTYIDRAYSARSDRRPEFQKMIGDSKSGHFQAVIVHKLDRFSRDRYDHAIYRKELKKNNVKLFSVLEALDDSPESVVLESVLEGFSEYYSRNLARETRKGLREVALQAKFTGGSPPFGFDIDADKNYIINPIEAEAVREIFMACYNGTGYDALLRSFSERGIRTKFGKPFSKASFHAILRNSKYIGTYTYYPEGTYREKKSVPIKIEDALPAIVPKHIFWEVQKIMDSRKLAGKNKAIEPYLLSGLIYCGECGSAMNGHRHTKAGRHYYDYECGANSRKKQCVMTSVARDKLENLACNYISELVSDQTIQTIKAYLLKNADLINDEQADKKKALEKEISSLETKINNVIDIMIDTPSDKLKSKLLDLEERQKQLQAELVTVEASVLSEDKLDKYILHIKDFQSLERQQKAIFIKKIIKKITVYKNGNFEILTTYGKVADKVGGATQI